LLAVAAIWSVWIAVGYPVNAWNGHALTSAGGFDPIAEALNVGTKTALAAAYFWPFVQCAEPRARAVRRPRSAGHDPQLIAPRR
jgi:hypothetical protein